MSPDAIEACADRDTRQALSRTPWADWPAATAAPAREDGGKTAGAGALGAVVLGVAAPDDAERIGVRQSGHDTDVAATSSAHPGQTVVGAYAAAATGYRPVTMRSADAACRPPKETGATGTLADVRRESR
jgi:hypothetical protein